MSETDELLRILISLAGRTAFPEEILQALIGPSPKNLAAYNLCDGSRTQAEVVKAAKVDQGQFSRAASRWVELGILFKLGTGREARLLHLYQLPSTVPSKKGQADSKPRKGPNAL